jgi:DNA polymerase I-like protein with 3'-5' exonuclease and polymerase domains
MLFELEDDEVADELNLLVHFATQEDRHAFFVLTRQPFSDTLYYPFVSRLPPDFMWLETTDVAQPDLLDIPSNWHDTWQGMPAYHHQDLTPWQTVDMRFKDQAGRQTFAREVGIQVTDDTKSAWFPPAAIDKVNGVRWKSTRPLNPRYPVYVPTKGRWDSAYTIKCLERIGVPYYAVVQPQERQRYEGVVKSGTFLELPAGLDGLVPARIWIMEHAIALGAERHWQLDDNIKEFYRYHENRQIRTADGTCMRIAEDFVDRYENVAVAGFQYFMFISRKVGSFPPYVLNTRVYSNSLINNKIPYRHRDVYNDDTDICLRALKDGWCTVQFNNFNAYKMPTMQVKGGNTPIYLGAEAIAKAWEAHAATCPDCEVDVSPTCPEGIAILEKDGRWRMAASLKRQHPDVTTVGRRFHRWQHYVDYRQFRRNALIPRPGVVPEGVDEYGLELVEVDEPERAPRPSPARSFSAPRSFSPKARPAGPSVFSFLQPVAAIEPAGIDKPSQPEEKTATANPQEPDRPSGQEPEQIPFDPQFFKDYLAVKGHRLLTRDGKFFVSDASTLTDVERAVIKKHRDALIALAEEWIDSSRRQEPSVPNGGDSEQVAGAAAGVSRPSVHDAERSASATLFEEPTQTLAQFLGSEPPRVDSYIADDPPELSGIDAVVLNFATDGADWTKGARPVGVTVSTLDGLLTRFLPFRFQYGGNLDEAAVKRWACEQLRGKKIINANTRFDMHMAREWGVDLEAHGCTFSDIQHTAALLDDQRGKYRKDGRKPFALDTLALDYLPGNVEVGRVDESRHHEHHASEVAVRERYTAQVVGRLRDVMYPELEKQELLDVQQLEDDVIPAVVEMEKNGSPLDLALLEQYHAECNERHDKLLSEVHAECGFPFDHTAKGWQALFERLGLPPTDGNAEAIIAGIDHPIVRKAHLAAQYASLDSKTFKAYRDAVGADGIMRFDINQLKGDDGGTVSGRFSIGYVQQVPNHDNHFAVFGDELFPRALFVPGSGQYLEADAMQIEQRLLVHYMDNRKLIAEYADDMNRLARGEEPVSYHKVTWKMLKEYKPDMLYGHTKNYNFAFQYGAKSIKLAVMMGFITTDEGDEIRRMKRWDDPRLKTTKEIEAIYRKMMPEAGALLDRASHLAKPACDEFCKRGDALHRQLPHRGYVKTLVGRRSRFAGNSKTYIGLNRVLQGTGADIMKRKLAELHRERKHTGFVMRLTIHDAVGGDATLPETRSRVSEILNAQSYALKVPILWSTKSGPNWAECK